MELIRIRPHDNRVREYNAGSGRGGSASKRMMRKRRMRRKIMGRAAILLAAACGVLFLCVGGIRYLIASRFFGVFAQTPVAESAGESQPADVLGEPAQPPANDVLTRQDETESHNPRIFIDPGHGGEDEGCSRDNVLESQVNLEIANRLSGKLNILGYETVLVREDNDTQLSLEERVQKAQAGNADMYVSIHQNACDETESEISGIETWYYGETEGSRRLAQLVHKGAVGHTGAFDREVRDTEELFVIREAGVPACLIETGFLSNRTERGNLSSGEYQDKLAEGIAEGIDTYFHPRTMYLTFDDGPTADNTVAVLDVLKERNIKATFFVVGENVVKHPEVARRIVQEGHTIGIHCNYHGYQEIYKSVDSYLEDFQKAYDAVYEVTGVEAKLFRFPGGSVNAYNKNVRQGIIDAMTEKGYIYFDWNASLEDAVKQSTPEGLIQNGVSSTLGRKKVVMLAHDVIYNTTQCLGELIDSLPEYEMLPLTPEVEPIQF